jgi:hypothetical protein
MADLRRFMWERKASGSREWDELKARDQAMADRAAEIDLPWPVDEFRKKVGRPSRQVKWQAALATWLNDTGGDTAWPESVSLEVPDWWLPGKPITRDTEKAFHESFVAAMQPMTETELQAVVTASIPDSQDTFQSSQPSSHGAAEDVDSLHGAAEEEETPSKKRNKNNYPTRGQGLHDRLHPSHEAQKRLGSRALRQRAQVAGARPLWGHPQ